MHKMKKQIFFLSIILAVGFICSNVQSTDISGTVSLPTIRLPDFSQLTAYPVARIVDGDTVVVDVNGTLITVRFVGVDTPETVHPFKPVEFYGKEASQFTKNLLKGEKVYLAYDQLQGKTDKFGRDLAYVYRAPEGLIGIKSSAC